MNLQVKSLNQHEIVFMIASAIVCPVNLWIHLLVVSSCWHRAKSIDVDSYFFSYPASLFLFIFCLNVII